MTVSYRAYLTTTLKTGKKINTPDYVDFLETEINNKIIETKLKNKQKQIDKLVLKKYLYNKAKINTPDYIKYLNKKYKELLKPNSQKVDKLTKKAIQNKNILSKKREAILELSWMSEYKKKQIKHPTLKRLKRIIAATEKIANYKFGD